MTDDATDRRDAELKRLREKVGADPLPDMCPACGATPMTRDTCLDCGADQWELLALTTLVKLQDVESQCVDGLGGGEIMCLLCRKTYHGEEREGDEKGPWHAPWCLMHRKEFA
jgi:hypothetical protein